MEPYTIHVPIQSPWDLLDWNTIADYSDPDEYYELDEIYKQIVCSTYTNSEQIEQLKKEYDLRFGEMLAEVLFNIAKDVKSGKLILKTDFES